MISTITTPTMSTTSRKTITSTTMISTSPPFRARRREIHEDAVRCPYCEQYVSREDAPPARKPWWIIAGAIMCLYIAWRWITA